MFQERYFYSRELTKDSTNLVLDEQESHHIIHVNKYNIGERFLLMNGEGIISQVEIVELLKKTVKVEIRGYEIFTPPTNILTIGVGILKNRDRMEWMIEKLTELGVHRIILLQTHRTERNKVNIERLEKVAISAIKQSGNPFMPKISISTIDEIILEEATIYSIAHCNHTIKHSLKEIYKETAPKKTILIGPEGDFTEEEVAKCLNKGFKEVSLGDLRLRTETAAIYAASIIQSLA
jgi:16S rRNA (uracil1498-N3)-methyltransferase